jgi:hypothetical protein
MLDAMELENKKTSGSTSRNTFSETKFQTHLSMHSTNCFKDPIVKRLHS